MHFCHIFAPRFDMIVIPWSECAAASTTSGRVGREKITAGVENILSLFLPNFTLFLTFTFFCHFHFLLSPFLTFREELLGFWNPGQCSAQQYEELEGLEDSAYDDEDDEEFYEDDEAEYVKLEDSVEVNYHEGEHWYWTIWLKAKIKTI